MRRWTKAAGVLGATAALTVGVAGTASAAAWTWQGYTKDASWHCEHTEYLNGLYLQPCVKVSGPYWQPILLATTTSQDRYIFNFQTAQYFSNGDETVANSGDCAGDVTSMIRHIPPWTSLACFSPTSTNHDVLAQGNFDVGVWASPSGEEITDTLTSPGVWTG